MRIVSIAHISVLVSDVGRALTFYRDVLDLAVMPTRPELGYPGAWLALGAQQIHLLQLPNPDPTTGRPPHAGRDRHGALHVEDLAGLKERLERAGIVYTTSRSGRRALFCRDPDGNGWEFIEA